MPKSSDFRDLVSGRRRGLPAAMLRGLLRLGELPYTWAVSARNRRFDRGHGVLRVSIPVISVGNLTMGGVGKTPLVAWLCRRLREAGVRVAIISRGYGAQQGGRNDEALELEMQLPDVPHLQDPDRVAAAGVAIEELASQMIVLDDGFQHRRLARDLDIVVIDALEPTGFGHVFPRGTLREPLAGLARADVVVLSRANLATPQQRAAIRRQAERLAPNALWCEAAHRPTELVNFKGGTAALSSLAERPIAAFCGIGNPAGFWKTLESLGCTPLGTREFADHHSYTKADVDELAAWAAQIGARELLCTRKDLVKLQTTHLGRVPLWALAVELAIEHGQAELIAMLERLSRRAAQID